MNKLKHYYAQVLICIGEHEVYTGYRFLATDLRSAEREVIEGYDIGGDDDEKVAELYSLVEVPEKDYDVLRKYT